MGGEELIRKANKSAIPRGGQGDPQIVSCDVPTAEDAALGQVVTPPGTCRGPARRFSRSHPQVHAGK